MDKPLKDYRPILARDFGPVMKEIEAMERLKLHFVLSGDSV